MKQVLSDKLKKERVKAILTKKLYDESFYGILGTHPDATKDDIEDGFRQKARKINSKAKLSKLLEAYSTLSSSSRKSYDEYLEKYKEGINKASELIYDKDISINDFIIPSEIDEQ